jgi:hypothetical protein
VDGFSWADELTPVTIVKPQIAKTASALEMTDISILNEGASPVST